METVLCLRCNNISTLKYFVCWRIVASRPGVSNITSTQWEIQIKMVTKTVSIFILIIWFICLRFMFFVHHCRCRRHFFVCSQYIRLKQPTQKYLLGSFQSNARINSFIMIILHIFFLLALSLYTHKKNENKTWERNEWMIEECACVRM